MTDDRRSTTIDDARLLPYLPMLYVAWSDGDLLAEEIAGICPQLDGPCRTLLRPWLDPEAPPSADELAQMLRLIQLQASSLDRREKLDLTGLGLELAQADERVEAVERRALERLEDALGIAGTEAARQLLATRRVARREPEPEPTFDAEAMTAVLRGPYAAVHERLFTLLEREEFAYRYDLKNVEYRQQVLDWCRILADEGIGRFALPEELGGEGDMGAFIAAFESLCFFDLSLVVKAGVQFGLFGGSILHLGTERHHRAYLEAAATLALPGCFAMTETSHGSNVADIETVARFDQETDELVITTPHAGARKDYIGNAAAHGRMATVFAQLELGEHEKQRHGVHAMLVPIRDEQGRPMPGVEIVDNGAKMGLNGVDNGRLHFHGVRVPRENLLDRFASLDADGHYESPISSPSKRFFTMLGTLVGGRVSVGWGALSVAKSALTIAVLYAVKRRQFGPEERPETRLLDYQTHQRRLLPRLARTYALHFGLEKLRRDFVESDPLDRREIEAEAAGLKALATWHCTETVQVCRECCGGQGYLAENRFAALKADSDVFTTFEGDNIVLLQLLAKSLLGNFKRQFGRLRPLGLVRWVAERAASTVAEMNPITTRLTSEQHLLSRDFQGGAFAWREDQLVISVARRLKKNLDELPMADALIACQDHLVAAARAHSERMIFEAFAAAVDTQKDARIRAVLGRLLDLHALSQLEADRGFFLEQGYFEGAKARAIRRLVLKLARELRPQASHLVRAFGIPEKLLGAPIAR